MGFLTGFGAASFALTVALLAASQHAPAPPKLPTSALPLRLEAVMVDAVTPSRSSALIGCPPADKPASKFFAGQKACEMAEVRDIRPDGVVVANLINGRREILPFHDSASKTTAAPPPPPPEVVAADPENVTVDLPSGSVEYYLDNLQDLLASARATPHYREGAGGQKEVDGFSIDEVTKAGVVGQVGLRNGDVITSVNGQPLDSVVAVIRLVGELPSMKQATMTVVRDGQAMTFVFNRK